jgi:predicted peptidase
MPTSAAANYSRLEYHSSQFGQRIKYLFFRPVIDDQNQKLPLVLFLHGKGQRGDDLSRVKVPRPLTDPKTQQNFPCFVVAPQCPADVRWIEYPLEDKSAYRIDDLPENGIMPTVMEIVELICRENPIDRNRIYLTGYSMGGFGAWYAAIQYLDVFAAVAPVSGAGDPTKAAVLATKPVWAFHGENDPTVPVEASRKMIEAITRSGGSPRYTEYPEAGHDINSRPYRDESPKNGNPDLIEWMFSQRKR